MVSMWRKVRSNKSLCSITDHLQPLPLSHRSDPQPHCDSAGEDAFESSLGECEALPLKPDLLQQPDEGQPLVSAFPCWCFVFCPAEVFGDVKTTS